MLNLIRQIFIKLKNKFMINKIAVYGIFNEKPIIDSKEHTVQNKNITPITFVTSLEQAEQVIDRLTYIHYFNHFSVWLVYTKRFTNTKPTYKSEAWYEYKTTVLPNIISAGDEYHVLKLVYTKKQLASLLRIFTNCQPLYLDYETDDEIIEYMKKKL